MARPDLPSGTVTLLFSDIAGSTRLLAELGAERYAAALEDHRRIIRGATRSHGGVEVDTQGDAFFLAFPTASGALAAARDAQAALAQGPIRVRMGIHTGTPIIAEEGYVGVDVHRAARIAAVGHGDQILVSAATAALSGDGLRDLGAHRLKDLSAPERIYQLGNVDFPPLRTLYRTNFPIPVTPFLGRERELAEIVELIRREDVRLVTLTGPGGTGKTRLGSQAAGEVSDHYPGGVWWVPLAPLRDPTLVLDSARQAVGASGSLAAHIGDTAMLILFDNFEQVVEAASDVADLLATCPNLSVLVTSREPLHILGEHEYGVPPMAAADAVALFMARSRAVDANLEPSRAVNEICARLDDLPLAIELAAARVKLLAPDKLLERLEHRLLMLTGGARDLPERQRTLRAAIDWSYDLLSSDEKRLFERLSVFRGGATLEAAEAIAEATMDTLQSLVDKSLIRRRAERYLMLETIREFAAETLERSGEAEAVRERHTNHFAGLVDEAFPHLNLDEADWANRLEVEQDNLRALLDRLASLDDTQGVLHTAGRLYRFWYLKSHLREGQRRLEDALRADDRPTPARALALAGSAVMALNLGDDALARRRAEEALALFRELGDAWGEAYSTMMVGNVISQSEAKLAEAAEYFEQSARRFDELGDEHFTLISLFNQAWVVGSLGNPARERALYDECIRRAELASASGRWRAKGPVERTLASAKAGIGMLERDEGRIASARSLLVESTRIFHEQGARLEVAINLGRLANVLVVGGSAESAAKLLAKSDALVRDLGVVRSWWDTERNDKTRELIAAEVDDENMSRLAQEGPDLAVEEALTLAEHANLAVLGAPS